MTNQVDDMLEGGAKGWSAENVGDHIEGTITAVNARQQTDPANGIGKTWSNGDPMMQLVFSIVTDDGEERAIYAKGGKPDVASGEGTSLLEAIKTALTAAGMKGSESVGHRLLVAHTGLGKKTNSTFNAPKLWKAKITRQAASTSNVSVDDLFA